MKDIHGAPAPSAWVLRHGAKIPRTGTVLDMACGSGRHSRYLVGLGHAVLAVDRNIEALAALVGQGGIETLQADLETDVWPLAGRAFAGVVVTNYLFRPRLADLIDLLAPGGVLLYETFMVGNEAYGRPSNPDFLLLPDELHRLAEHHGLEVLDFAQGHVARPAPAVVQAICARRPA